ncbi:hypothetical protein LSAT2_024457 [Lamellibrachia satsuma]|nr:hypothetical protein LSAT2_024457 [Lamellibrachia satsuma]
MYDLPHFMKNVSNNFKKHGIVVDGKAIQWKHVESFYATDSSKLIQIAPRLTKRHIELPPFTAMQESDASLPQWLGHGDHCTGDALGETPHGPQLEVSSHQLPQPGLCRELVFYHQGHGTQRDNHDAAQFRAAFQQVNSVMVQSSSFNLTEDVDSFLFSVANTCWFVQETPLRCACSCCRMPASLYRRTMYWHTLLATLNERLKISETAHNQDGILRSREQHMAEHYMNLVALVVKQETAKDSTLQAVISLVRSNKWYNTTQYQGTDVDQAALQLQQSVDIATEEAVKRSIPSQMNTTRDRTTIYVVANQRAMVRNQHQIPTGEYLLVIVDEYSRYPIVEVMRSTSMETVIPVVDKFSLFSFPEVVKTDNGPPSTDTFGTEDHQVIDDGDTEDETEMTVPAEPPSPGQDCKRMTLPVMAEGSRRSAHPRKPTQCLLEQIDWRCDGGTTDVTADVMMEVTGGTTDVTADVITEVTGGVTGGTTDVTADVMMEVTGGTTDVTADVITEVTGGVTGGTTDVTADVMVEVTGGTTDVTALHC